MFFGCKKHNWPPGSHTCFCMALGRPRAHCSLGTCRGNPGPPDFVASHRADNSLTGTLIELAIPAPVSSQVRQRSTISTGAGLSTCSNLCKLGSSPKQLYWAVASYPAPFGHPRSLSLFSCPAQILLMEDAAYNSHKSALNSTGIHKHKELRTLSGHHYTRSCRLGLKPSMFLC